MQLPSTITQAEYSDYLDSYIREQMTLLPEGRKSLSFWANFNRDKKVEFDQILVEQGTVVNN